MMSEAAAAAAAASGLEPRDSGDDSEAAADTGPRGESDGSCAMRSWIHRAEALTLSTSASVESCSRLTTWSMRKAISSRIHVVAGCSPSALVHEENGSLGGIRGLLKFGLRDECERTEDIPSSMS